MNTPKKDHKSLPDGTLVAIRFRSAPDYDRIVVVRGGDLYGPSDYNERHPHQWGNVHSGHYLSLRVIDLPPADPDADVIEVIEKSVPIGSWDGREVLRRLRAEGFDVTHEAKS